MAFKTLDQLRTVNLNDELGLALDTDTAWGTTAQRNGFILRSIAKLWPTVGRLTRETVTTVALQMDYTLTTLVDVERIEIIDPASLRIVSDRVRSWQLYEDETADPPTKRLLIPSGINAGMTLQLIGYVPYILPGAGGTACDIPPRLEWLVTTGAVVEACRVKVRQFVNFERMQNENRPNALSAADILELLRDAKRDFEKGLADNARNLTGAKRARLTTG